MGKAKPARATTDSDKSAANGGRENEPADKSLGEFVASLPDERRKDLEALLRDFRWEMLRQTVQKIKVYFAVAAGLTALVWAVAGIVTFSGIQDAITKQVSGLMVTDQELKSDVTDEAAKLIQADLEPSQELLAKTEEAAERLKTAVGDLARAQERVRSLDREHADGKAVIAGELRRIREMLDQLLTEVQQPRFPP